MEQLFDNYTNQLAKKYKVETIPWLRVTEAVVFIFFILVLLQMLKRDCFLSLTVVTLAMYVLNNPGAITR